MRRGSLIRDTRFKAFARRIVPRAWQPAIKRVRWWGLHHRCPVCGSRVRRYLPEGYAFPLYHRVWAPLRLNSLHDGPGSAPRLGSVFGRLAPGVSLAEAQAELDQVGLRTAADSPETHARLRPQVIPYPQSFFEMSGLLSAAILSSNLLLMLFLVLVCANVALLMFALIHFLAITGTGIHIDISNQVAINSAYAILQIELALFIFGMLPIVAFVNTAITRDFEHATASMPQRLRRVDRDSREGRLWKEDSGAWSAHWPP